MDNDLQTHQDLFSFFLVEHGYISYMHKKLSTPAIFLLLIHYGFRMWLVYVATHFILVRAAKDLFYSLPSFSLVAQLYVAMLQLSALIVISDIRGCVIKDAFKLMEQIPAQKLRRTLTAINIIFVAGIVPNIITVFSFAEQLSWSIILETVILLAFVWSSAGIAVPLSATRFWKWFLKYHTITSD